MLISAQVLQLMPVSLSVNIGISTGEIETRHIVHCWRVENPRPSDWRRSGNLGYASGISFSHWQTTVQNLSTTL